MATTFAELTAAAIDLPEDERATLTRLLLDSLDEGGNYEIDREAFELLEKRFGDCESGHQDGIPAAVASQAILNGG